MTDLIAQEFIQDFLEESNEHLQSIHKNLLLLEQSNAPSSGSVENAVERVGLINELFRSFHTLKGLSGMVGLAPAEELSHAMESILRAIQQMKIDARQEVIDQLLHGRRLLETVIHSVQTPGARLPETGPELASLAALLSEREPAPHQALEPLAFPYPEIPANLHTLEQSHLLAARSAGKVISLAVFTPSPEKANRDIHVNTLRDQLSAIGELVKAMPLIQGASIRFAFLIASSHPLDSQVFPELEWYILEPSQAERQHAPATRPSAPVEAKLAPVEQAGQIQPGQAPPAPTTIRVDLERMDDLMRLVSDLVVTRYRMVELLPSLRGAPEPALDAVLQTVNRMERSLRELRQAVIRTRLVPLSEVFSHMPLAVRELARASGKELTLVMEGETTEVDKYLVDRLLDPLLHLVRNAITHGIETPLERVAAGKSPQGALTLRGVPQGENILITISDDGRGMDFEKILQKAISLGLVNQGGNPLTSAEALELICLPGFTTKGEVDLGSGRGVGMDIVSKMIQSIGGRLDLETISGQGTTFFLYLPVTLTIVAALIVRCGEERYAIPQRMVDQVIEIDPEQISRIEGGEIYPFRQNSLTLLRLSDLFRLPCSKSSQFLYGLISNEGERRTALVVDHLVGLREVVVHTIVDPLVACPGIAGATELGDGSVILILDLPSLFKFLGFKKKG